MKIAVIIPAYNEEHTIANVVREYQAALPGADIIVGDNNSVDRTSELAIEAGARVVRCKRQGKGNAVRHLFEEVDADIYIMTDADETYSAANINELLDPVRNGQADMVVGARQQVSKQAFSLSHKFGNFILTSILNRFFKVSLQDVLSGYRVISKDLVERLILLAEGSEIEVELTIRTLEERYSIVEIPIDYRNRPEGSISKLSTWGDGFLILYTIVTLFRDYNPMVFFVMMSSLFFVGGLASGIYLFVSFLQTGAMFRTGLAIVTAMSILMAAIIFFMGLILDSFNNHWRRTQESMRRMKRMINDRES